MQGIQRGGVPSGKSTDCLIVVIADGTSPQTGQQESEDQQPWIACGQCDREARVGKDIQDHQRVFQPDHQRNQPGEEAGGDISGRVRGDQIAADLIAEPVFCLEHGQDRADEDRINTLDQIQEKEVPDHIAVFTVQRMKERFLFHGFRVSF